ncbi:MAG: hypothetical protein ACJ72N_20705 [Labedaea sp.]
MTRRGADLPGRALSIVVRALPPHRTGWGMAMRAELGAIDSRQARRRFVVSCARAVLTSGPALRAVAGYAGVLVFAVVVLGRAADLPSAGVRAEAGALVAIIAVLAWWGRRRGILGPVGTNLVPRLCRLVGYVTVMATVVLLLTLGTNDPAGWWLAALAVGVYLVGFLRSTAEPMTNALSLPTAAALSLAGLTLWWIPMLLLDAVRSSPALTFLVALALIPAGMALGSRTGAARRGLSSGLAAATATLLLMFLAAVLTYRLAPGLVPDISGPGGIGGLTPAAKAETNRIESVDPYVADFLFGALLSGVLTVVSILANRPLARPAMTPAAQP